MENTYWNNKGKHQALAQQLQLLVPLEGEIKGKTNAKLEKFRKASNAYYDIFNNGGINRPQAIRAIFGFSMGQYRRGNSFDWERIYARTEPVMDKLVASASAEQLAEA